MFSLRIINTRNMLDIYHYRYCTRSRAYAPSVSEHNCFAFAVCVCVSACVYVHFVVNVLRCALWREIRLCEVLARAPISSLSWSSRERNFTIEPNFACPSATAAIINVCVCVVCVLSFIRERSLEHSNTSHICAAASIMQLHVRTPRARLLQLKYLTRARACVRPLL